VSSERCSPFLSYLEAASRPKAEQRRQAADREERLRPVFCAARPAGDPLRYVSVVGKNVLVISTVEHADDSLRAVVGDAETVKVVVPVVRQGALDWLANDEKAFGHAERVAERTAEQLSGETVDAIAGEANVGLAIRDALATFPADEIVVAVRPHEQEGLVESSATKTAPQQSIEGVPVRYVVIPD
jgi:hypothetical protein